MATLTVQKVTKAGAALTYSAVAAGGDSYPYVPNSFIHVRNGHISQTRTVTIAAVTTPVINNIAGSLTVPNISVEIAAASDRLITVPPTHIAAGGTVSMTYSNSGADITVAIARLTQE